MILRAAWILWWLLVGAQEAMAAPVVELPDPEHPVALTGIWKRHRGDNIAWALPDYDDSAWESISVPVPGTTEVSGYTWYRLEVWVGTTEHPLTAEEKARLGVLLGKIYSAYELYAGGTLLGGIGTLPPDPKIDFDKHRIYALPIAAVDENGRLVLALRTWQPSFSKWKPLKLREGPQDGPFFIGSLRVLTRRELISEIPHLFLVVIFSLLGIYHLDLWRRRPQLTPYVWFSVLSLGFAVFGLMRTQWRYLLTDNFLLLEEIEHLSVYVLLPVAIQVFYPLLGLRIGLGLRIVQGITVAGGIAVALPGMNLNLNLALLPLYEIVLLGATLTNVWFAFREASRAHPEARIVAGGLIVFFMTVFSSIAVERGIIQAPRLIVFGFAAVVLSIAISLANQLGAALFGQHRFPLLSIR